jgi:hypothetical protein
MMQKPIPDDVNPADRIGAIIHTVWRGAHGHIRTVLLFLYAKCFRIRLERRKITDDITVLTLPTPLKKEL